MPKALRKGTHLEHLITVVIVIISRAVVARGVVIAIVIVVCLGNALLV